MPIPPGTIGTNAFKQMVRNRRACRGAAAQAVAMYGLRAAELRVVDGTVERQVTPFGTIMMPPWELHRAVKPLITAK